MFGLQALGAIGKGVSDGAEEIRRMNKESRDKKQFEWAEKDAQAKDADRTTAKNRLEQFTNGINSHKNVEALIGKGDLQGAFDVVGSHYNDNVPDGHKAKVIVGEDGNKVIHVFNDKGGFVEQRELNADSLRAAAQANLAHSIGVLSPENYASYIATLESNRRDDRNFNANRADARNAQNNFLATMTQNKDQFEKSYKLQLSSLGLQGKQLEASMQNLRAGQPVYFFDKNQQQQVAYPRYDAQTKQFVLEAAGGLPQGASVVNTPYAKVLAGIGANPFNSEAAAATTRAMNGGSGGDTPIPVSDAYTQKLINKNK
jgi:hypothetical protein